MSCSSVWLWGLQLVKWAAGQDSEEDEETFTLVEMNHQDFLQSYLLKVFISLEAWVLHLNSP